MAQVDSKYLPELMAEKDNIDSSYVHAVRLMTEEIEKIKNPPPPSKSLKDEKKLIDIVSGRMQRVEIDVRVPVEKYPKINFVGRLIGPGGSTMKGIQEVTATKMAVLGKGSVRERDRKKAEELHAQNDPKYAHLDYPLHVHISSLAPAPQAYINIGRALAEVQKLLIVDEQNEGQYDGNQGMSVGVQSGRGGMASSGGFRGGRGATRGGPRGGSRGGGMRGGATRGAATPRGGGLGGQRGVVRGAPRGRGAGRGQNQAYAQLSQVADSYTDEYGYDASYGSVAAAASAYDTTGYEEYDASYDATYDAAYGAEAAAYADGSYADAGYEDYNYGTESYDAYGNGASVAAAVKPSYVGGGGQGSFRGKMRGGMRGRQKPY